MDGVPAVLGIPGRDDVIEAMLLVGAINPQNGKLFQKTNMDVHGAPHVYAPGDWVLVAEGNTVVWPDKLYKDSSGTSDGR